MVLYTGDIWDKMCAPAVHQISDPQRRVGTTVAIARWWRASRVVAFRFAIHPRSSYVLRVLLEVMTVWDLKLNGLSITMPTALIWFLGCNWVEYRGIPTVSSPFTLIDCIGSRWISSDFACEKRMFSGIALSMRLFRCFWSSELPFLWEVEPCVMSTSSTYVVCCRFRSCCPTGVSAAA